MRFPEKARQNLARLEVHKCHERGAVVQEEENGGERGGELGEDRRGEGKRNGRAHSEVHESAQEDEGDAQVDHEGHNIKSIDFGEQRREGEEEEVEEVEEEGETESLAVFDVVNRLCKREEEAHVGGEGRGGKVVTEEESANVKELIQQQIRSDSARELQLEGE
jgi:hypothetical protein